jgi:hypothetical protein
MTFSYLKKPVFPARSVAKGGAQKRRVSTGGNSTCRTVNMRQTYAKI